MTSVALAQPHRHVRGKDRVVTEGERLGRFLREWRRKRGLSRPEAINELAKLDIEISYGYLAKLESGARSLAVAALEYREGLRKIYRIPADEWLAETGLHVPVKEPRNEVELAPDLTSGSRDILVYDLLSGGPGADGGTVIDVIAISDEFKGDHIAYEVSGDSMAPEIRSGDRVVVRIQDYASPGNEVVCFVPDHGMLVKYLDRIEDGLYVLTSYNPEYKPIWTSEIKIYGVVVEVRKRRRVVNGNHGPN